MRRLALVLAAAATAAAAVPALAGEAPLPAAEQKQVGSVAAPVALVARVPRTLALTDRSSNGLTGFAFEVDPATIGGPFALKVTSDPTGQGDLQIGFYSSLGTAQEPGTVTGEFLTEAKGGEKGYVPEGTKTVLVYLNVGAQVGFSYAAQAPVGVALSGELDVTLPAGQAVRWTNDTDAPLIVASTPDAFGFSDIDSGEIAPGATFSAAFPAAGTVGYTAGGRSGTITITG